ncbi:hypothetical protein D9623_00495 [Azospirillum brasilense]|uniref:Uncharacterized protein n=1 Tax=Azospirillum brasilense TaxID=192 RepID=A0A0P0E7R8_AZOBR|nr:hypothetical protein AMK58_01715 [Azospirillum brasilense]PWC92588.1 hypothetical protein AEJ54_15495 [Azospirillum sp. Sp 7]OPH15351.1 hypothetical protein FE89_11250 [Azospirillum brasilense]OPH20562.1 hypothetical protein FE88_12875 [Azospirillum brasilense]QCO09298.1 hypothetical protein D3868_09795 [Azospirillum brasilense]
MLFEESAFALDFRLSFTPMVQRYCNCVVAEAVITSRFNARAMIAVLLTVFIESDNLPKQPPLIIRQGFENFLMVTCNSLLSADADKLLFILNYARDCPPFVARDEHRQYAPPLRNLLRVDDAACSIGKDFL